MSNTVVITHDKAPASHRPLSRAFAMSVDVEDFFQVWAFSSVIKRESWDGFSLRVGDATRACLDLFEAHGVVATFFTLGWVAERDPDLIRAIVDRGHELASHGYDHQKVFDQSRDQFRDDVRKTKHLLEDIAGVPVSGYRAPGFSIDARSPWAYETLAEMGYRYSSSAHPIAHDHYGDPQGRQTPYAPVSGLDFIEAPVATVDFLGRRVSCAGGGWFRAAPLAVSKVMLRRAAAALNGPVIFYIHPWELDPDQPRIRNAPASARFRHYLNIKNTANKLDAILRAFPWARIDDALALDAEERQWA